MQLTLRALAQNRVTEKVDFIFDKASSPREERFIRNAWEMFWAQMDNWPDEYAPMKRILGEPVQFKDDKEVLPLQAADLYAWFARQHGEHRAQGNAYDHLAWQSLCAVPGPTREWTEAELTDEVRQIHEFAKAKNLTLQYDPRTGKRNPRKR